MRPLALFGAALAVSLWLSPLAEWAGAPFAGHMLRHIALVAVVAPALVLGWPALARALAAPPLLAAVVEFAVVWGWHLPAARALAALPWGLVLEQASFLLAGILVWAGALRADRPLAGAGALLLTSMHMTLLGALLILAPRDLFAAALHASPDLTGQQLGGILMLAIGTPAYLAGGLWVVRRDLGAREART